MLQAQQRRECRWEEQGHQPRGSIAGGGMAAASGRAGMRVGEEALEAWARAAHRCEGVGEVGNIGRGATLRQGFALHEHRGEHKRKVGTWMKYRPYDHGRGNAGTHPTGDM